MRENDNNKQLRIVKLITVVVVAIILSGCSILQKNSPTPSPTMTTVTVEPTEMRATETLIATAFVTPIAEPDIEVLSPSRTAYQFEVDLDYNKHSLDVRQTIQYQNKTEQALSEIKLVVPPNVKTRVFALESLILTGDVNLTDYELDGNTLTISLDQPLHEAGRILIVIDYALTPRLQGGILGYTAKQLNLSDWYPFVPPYDAANGWIIHQPSVVGEYLVYDNADFDITLNLVNATGLTVAASAEAAPIDLDSYKIIQNNAKGITFSVSDRYTVVTNTTNGITVKGYIFEGDEIAGQAAVDYTATALQLYSELFGLPYPHQTLSVVESDFPDGMEYDGLYYLSDFYFKNYDGTFQNYLALLSVHETSHQWWFGAVANDQALEPWLDESLATYSEYLYIERYYPELTNWWWNYRVSTYQPAGRVNLTIYDQSDLRVYINAVYLQGATFLDKLRQALGDDAFFAGLKTYANTYNQQVANWDEFIKIMKPDPSEAIDVMLQEYFK